MGLNKRLISTASAGVDNTGHFQLGTYTGGGSSDVSVSGLGFRPDLLMVRNLDSSGTINYWFNGDRRYAGFDGETSVTSEYFDNEYQYWGTGTNFLTYDADGFTVSTNSGSSNLTNKNGDEFLYYAWFLDGNLGASSASDTAGVFVVQNSGSGFRSVGFSNISYNHYFSYSSAHFIKDGSQQDNYQRNNYYFNNQQAWSSNHTDTTLKFPGTSQRAYIGFGNADGSLKSGFYDGGLTSSNEETVGFSPRALFVLKVLTTNGSTTGYWWNTAIDSNNIKYTRFKADNYTLSNAGKITSSDSGYGVTFTSTGFYFDATSEDETNATGNRYFYMAIG